MIRKVKLLTLAVVAVCAFGAVSASGASAAEFHIADLGQVQGHGTQIAGAPAEFTVPEGALKCASAVLTIDSLTDSAGVVREKTGQTVTATVLEGGTQTLTCTFAGLAGSIVHMNGCDFKIHTTGGGSTALQATVLCPAGQQITVTALVFGVVKCTIHIPEQGELQGGSATNGPEDINLNAAFQGIKYQSTTGSGLGACTNTTNGTDGKLNGQITVQATVNGAASKLQIG